MKRLLQVTVWRPLLLLRLGWQSLRVWPRRAALAIAAIAGGTLILLVLLSFGHGLARPMTGNPGARTECIAVIWPGETSKAWRGRPPGRAIRISADDVDLARDRLPAARAVVGEMVAWRAELARGERTVRAQIIGASFAYGDVRGHHPRPGGRFFGPVDEAGKRPVIFLGDQLKQDLFGDEEAVGRTLRVQDRSFTVIGVLQPRTGPGSDGAPERSHGVIPLTTFRELFGRHTLDSIVVQVESPERMTAAIASLKQALGGKYGFDPDDPRVLATWSTVMAGAMTRNIIIGIALLLGVIGALLLLAGAVGLSRILSAAIRERSREIGVQMALGARGAWITLPLLLEGLLYTAAGGALGLLAAGSILGLLGRLPAEGNRMLELLGRPALTWPIGTAAAVLLGLLGLAASYPPARRAALLDPASALRHP